MKKYTPLIIFILFIISCNTETPSKNTQHIDKNITEKTNIPIKISKTENQYLIKKYSKLFNTELVGLIKDSINPNNYYVDFLSACMCDSPSILLQKDKVYIFGFCKDTLPPISTEPFYIYNIIKIKETANKLTFCLINKEDNQLTLKFVKTSNKQVFKLVVNGYFPNEYVGSRLCHYFTYDVSKFTVEDCGDFDG